MKEGIKMNEDLEQKLRKMGVGWFILRYASEQSIQINTSIDYGSSKSMATRESTYQMTKPNHHTIVSELHKRGLRGNVSAGNPCLHTSEIKKILSKI